MYQVSEKFFLKKLFKINEYDIKVDNVNTRIEVLTYVK